MKSYSSREVIKILKEDDWHHVGSVGDHHHYKHPSRQGKVTVSHPVEDIPIGTLKGIEKQAGITFK